MKLGNDAVQFISKILILVLHEFVEEMPESITAVQMIIKKLFPSTWGTFVVKSTDTEFKANTDRSWLRRREPKSKEAKCVALLMSKIKDILKGNLEDRVVYYIYSILDEIINDILKWTSISVNKFQSERPVIDKRVLIAAIHTDRGLSELLEKLLPTAANDYSAIEYYQQTSSANANTNTATLPKTGRQPLYDYDKVNLWL
uniref:Uncharacterized protein n=1 Tax=Panagrolaimus superbus TaxID=310955 RepID=A0A914YZJ6_9BILA